VALVALVQTSKQTPGRNRNLCAPTYKSEDLVSVTLILRNSAEFAISAASFDLYLYSHTFGRDGQSRAHRR
jgi:hypothetical protein